jgi:hypothetical protein
MKLLFLVVLLLEADGKVTKRLRAVARKLVERAEQGDVPAIKEIFDRVDGRRPRRNARAFDSDRYWAPQHRRHRDRIDKSRNHVITC